MGSEVKRGLLAVTYVQGFTPPETHLPLPLGVEPLEAPHVDGGAIPVGHLSACDGLENTTTIVPTRKNKLFLSLRCEFKQILCSVGGVHLDPWMKQTLICSHPLSANTNRADRERFLVLHVPHDP